MEGRSDFNLGEFAEQQVKQYKSHPNVTSSWSSHKRHCPWPDVDEYPTPGDVRRCEHGRIQIAYTVIGMGPGHWRDLSRIFDPILYRRAKRLLDGEE